MLNGAMYFVIYSFMGFILETLFALVVEGSLESRKCFLMSYLCPVYGFGAIAIILATYMVKNNKIATFLLGMIAATVIEFIADYIYSEVLGARIWCYSSMPLNINGRVCLLFSIFWGILSLGLVYIVHPYVKRFVGYIPNNIALFILIFICVDSIISAVLLNRFKTKDALSMRWLLSMIKSS